MIRIKKLKPMFNSIITTMDKYEKDVETNGIIDTKNNYLQQKQALFSTAWR